MPPPTLLAQLPRVPDIPVERGRGADEGGRVKAGEHVVVEEAAFECAVHLRIV